MMIESVCCMSDTSNYEIDLSENWLSTMEVTH